MTARIRSIDYEHDGVLLGGELAWDDAWNEPRPCVLVVHDAMKSTAGFEEERAVTLAGMGYAGFVVDVYGKGVHATTNDESYALMAPFQADRSFLRRRLLAAVQTAAALPEVDAERLAAIGYCFGGMCVLEMARMNAPVLGVASFHGLLAEPGGDTSESKTGPQAGGRSEGAHHADKHSKINPSVLALHGWDDPYVPPDTIEPFAKEMSDREADWQLVAFGNTLHSFSNPGINMPEQGVAYDARAEKRSWRMLRDFLSEIFSV